MVLMGGSVAMSGAAGCGGMTKPDSSGGTTASGGSDGPGTGGSSSGGTSAGSGGRAPAAGGSGGLIIEPPETGGSTGDGGQLGFGGADPGDCEPYQLVCPAQNLYTACSNTTWHLALPSFCECDTNRPTSRDDCGENESFVCMGASESATGEPLEPVVPYNCECVQAESDGCWLACSNHSLIEYASTYCDDPGEVSPDLDVYLCGCAMTLLK
jgi:hypothetical protein